MKKAISSALFVVLLLGLSWVVLSSYRLLYRPMFTTVSTPVILSIDKKTSAAAFVRELHRQQFIHNPHIFLWITRVQGLANKLKAGVYEIKMGETAQQFLLRVVNGDVLVLPFQIIEGSTQATVKTQLDHLPYILKQPDAWSAISTGHYSAEGLLLADTYRYSGGSTDVNVLRLAHSSLMQVLNQSWASRAQNLPYKSAYELLIAASIIEKEASKADEKRLISGVIVNRLTRRMPLQMDPTVIYALGARYNGTLTHEDLSVDSPYNTYKHYGLPPTPIAMVGKDSIDAAAHPTVTNYLYFVARGDGRHHFSETYVQQQKAISTFSSRAVQ